MIMNVQIGCYKIFIFYYKTYIKILVIVKFVLIARVFIG
jgi:hypothetical protein